jgi:transposase
VSRERRLHSREFELAALARLETAPNVLDLSRERGVARELQYVWRRLHIRGGEAALRSSGRPHPVLMPSADSGAIGAAPPALAPAGDEKPAAACLDAGETARAQKRIAELERKAGQQQLELDFVGAALRRVRAPRRQTGGRDETASTRRSSRGCSSKAMGLGSNEAASWSRSAGPGITSTGWRRSRSRKRRRQAMRSSVCHWPTSTRAAGR